MVLQSVQESDHRPEDEALRANSAGQSPLPAQKRGRLGRSPPLGSFSCSFGEKWPTNMLGGGGPPEFGTKTCYLTRFLP